MTAKTYVDTDRSGNIEQHRIVSREEWLAARRELLRKEKEYTRAGDRLAAERRELPWVKVEKNYEFDGVHGRQTLADLFAGRCQLIVYHFMFEPGWSEGCKSCSFLADHIDGANLHLAHHDVTLLAISRAPWRELLQFKQRMGWHFDWASSFGSDFNYDYHVSASAAEIAVGKRDYNFTSSDGGNGDWPGISVFYKNERGEIFHTYSAYARGGDMLLGTHHYLDLAPKGRNEAGTMDWVRHHDKYDSAPGNKTACCAALNDRD